MINLIPAIIIGISTLLGIKGGRDTYDATKRINAAKKKYQNRRTLYERAEQTYCSERGKAEKAFQALGEIRLKSLIVLGKAVDFLKKARIKDRDLIETFHITPQQLDAWELASANALEIVGGLVGAGISGASTAAAAYGLVGLLGTASTGTAISSLSGVAATNATLAWLGGGSLATGGGGVAAGTFALGGLVIGPAILVVGLFAQGKAEKIETQVANNIAEMEIAEAEMARQLAVLQVILKRVDELRLSTIELTGKLEQILRNLDKSQSNFLLRWAKIIWRFLLKVFAGRDLYLEEAYFVARTAKGLGDLLDTAILDNKGNLIP